jgi:hypothetical protein
VLGGCCRECCVGHWCREKTSYDACIATPGVGPQSPKPQCAGTNRRVLVYSPVMLSSIMQREVLQDCPVVGGAGGAPLNVLMCALLSCKYVHNAAALAARTARSVTVVVVVSFEMSSGAHRARQQGLLCHNSICLQRTNCCRCLGCTWLVGDVLL